MTSVKLLRITLSTFLIFSSQYMGVQYAYSTTISVPGNVVVRASQNAEYLNGTLTVSWDVVSGATAYAVMATRSGTSTYSTVSVSGEKNTQAVVSGLAGGVTYVVQVRAIQNIDASAWSANTLTAIPITIPKSVGKPTAVAGVGSATVNWNLLAGNEDGGSAITSYVVREVNSGTSVSVSPTESTARFTDLTQGAATAFKVIAISDVSATGSMSVASDEITILSAENVSPDASASPSASAQPTSPVEVSVAPSPSSGAGGGGSGGGGGGFFGGGGANPIPSPPGTVSPSPVPTPSPSTFIPSEKTPLEPAVSQSPSPTSSGTKKPTPVSKTTASASPSPIKSYLEVTTSRVNLTTIKSTGKNSTLTISATKNLAITLPTVKTGSKVVSKVRTPSGAIFTLSSFTVKKTGIIKLPTIDFKKTGIYQVTTTINGKVSTLKITVKK